MKATTLTRITQEVIDLKLKAADIVFEELVDPLVATLNNPEKVIGKKYEEWIPRDLYLQLLTQVYGTGNETPLAKLIFSKSLEEVKRLESEV